MITDYFIHIQQNYPQFVLMNKNYPKLIRPSGPWSADRIPMVYVCGLVCGLSCLFPCFFLSEKKKEREAMDLHELAGELAGASHANRGKESGDGPQVEVWTEGQR